MRSIPQRLRTWGWLKTYAEAALSDARGWARGERDPLIPPRYRLYAGWRGDSVRLAQRWVQAAEEIGGLTPSSRVLDIGCGPGRMAAALTQRLEGGSYDGFDIVPRSIRWCQGEITTRYPAFRFQLADIRNAQYNPSGSQEAGEYRFPYPDGEFDLSLAASVYTHMRPREIERYVGETARVLKPGGRTLASFFLLNEDTELRLSISHRRELGPEQDDSTRPYRSGDPVTPEHMIVVYERDVRPIYAEAGLEIESIRYGSWCGRQKPYAGLGQDLIVARRV